MKNNLTDTEIKQAIQCHKELDCDSCPLKNAGYCTKVLMENTIELFDRLQAENERLKLELADTKRDLQIVLDNSISAKLPHCVLCGKGAILTKSLEDYDELIADISAEAYKECIEKIKEHSNKMELVCSGALVRTDYTITEDKFDNLLKEMVGEDNVSK